MQPTKFFPWTRAELDGAVKKNAILRVDGIRLKICDVVSKTQSITRKNELFFLYSLVVCRVGRKTTFAGFLRIFPWGNLAEFSTENMADSKILKPDEDFVPIVDYCSERGY